MQAWNQQDGESASKKAKRMLGQMKEIWEYTTQTE